MPLSRTRDYMSIGEVLEALRADFPDISVSKIRFLEAEGLIAPERTGSGYRKFFADDLARLRYILSLQRDHFLPLKVIRERLAAADSNGGVPAVPFAVSAPGPGAPETSGPTAPADLTDVSMSLDELLAAAGLARPEADELIEYGVLSVPDDGIYGGGDLAVATAAKGLLDRGLEARHLRMYKQFAEREAAFFEQLAGPPAARRDPDRRRQAALGTGHVVTLAARLHDGLLRAALRDVL